MSKNLVPNAKKVDNPIYWINLYPEDTGLEINFFVREPAGD